MTLDEVIAYLKTLPEQTNLPGVIRLLEYRRTACATNS